MRRRRAIVFFVAIVVSWCAHAMPPARPPVLLLTDAQCLGYDAKHFHLAAAYINIQASPRDVRFEYSGVGSSVNEIAHDLRKGYRLLPLRKDGQAGWFGVWMRQMDTDPLTDQRSRAVHTGVVSELPKFAASALGLRCDDEATRRRATR